MTVLSVMDSVASLAADNISISSAIPNHKVAKAKEAAGNSECVDAVEAQPIEQRLEQLGKQYQRLYGTSDYLFVARTLTLPLVSAGISLAAPGIGTGAIVLANLISYGEMTYNVGRTLSKVWDRHDNIKENKSNAYLKALTQLHAQFIAEFYIKNGSSDLDKLNTLFAELNKLETDCREGLSDLQGSWPGDLRTIINENIKQMGNLHHHFLVLGLKPDVAQTAVALYLTQLEQKDALDLEDELDLEGELDSLLKKMDGLEKVSLALLNDVDSSGLTEIPQDIEDQLKAVSQLREELLEKCGPILANISEGGVSAEEGLAEQAKTYDASILKKSKEIRMFERLDNSD